MLLYRPLLAAYQQTDTAAVCRYILRELADPMLHAEPDELLEAIAANRSITTLGEPARLLAEVGLRQRSLRLRLTTRDEARKLGGLWTGIAESRERLVWTLSRSATGALARAAGAMLGRTPVKIARDATDHHRALALSVLGNFGVDLAFESLADELMKGPMAPAAAIGLSQIDAAAAQEAILPAVQGRGLRAAAPFLGIALAQLASERTLPLLVRMVRAKEPEVREQAAWALGSFREVDVAPVLDALTGETDPFVRLNLIRSLGRLGVPGGRDTLRRFYFPNDPEIIRIAIVRAAGSSTAVEMLPFLERTLSTGNADELAESLQALVCLGVPGTGYLPAARQAVKASHARAALVGLLALSVWAPDEAFTRIVQIFAGPAGPQWFLATYVLRYLKTPQTVPLLVRLCKGVRGNELEEFAVSALCRHLDEPEAIRTLVELTGSSPSPAVTRRMMHDLARHLPESHRTQVAAEIRKLVERGLGSAIAPSVLLALGSLGGPGDVELLSRFARGATSPAAVRAIELLSDPSIEALLERIASEGDQEAASPAAVALFRRGSPAAAIHLQRMAASPDELPLAVEALFEMGLSVRLAKVVASLAPLVAVLEQRAKMLPEPPARRSSATASSPEIPGAPLSATSSVAGEPPPVTRVVPDLHRVLGRTGRVAVAEQVLPSLAKGPDPDTGKLLYTELGRYIKAGAGETRVRRNWVVALVLIVLLVLSTVIFVVRGRLTSKTEIDPDEVRKLSRYPPLYRAAAADPEEGAVRMGDTLDTQGQPVKLLTRIKENSLTVKGKFRPVEIRFGKEPPLQAELTGDLITGGIEVHFPRGIARVVVEGARTTVEVARGRAVFELKDSTFRLNVHAGKARILRGPILMKTLNAGQGGEFLDGNPMGRIEEFGADPE
jgi:HEAT repeat protein